MLFRLIVAVASVSFISQGAIAQVTDGQLVTDLGVVASVSSNALAVLDPISTSSSKSDVQSAAQVGQGHFACDYLAMIVDLNSRVGGGHLHHLHHQ
jgi:hypothetical protein